MGFRWIRMLMAILCMGTGPIYAITAKLKVGVVYPNSGSAASIGKDYLNGIELALKDHIQANDKIRNFVNIVTQDDQSRTDGARDAAKYLFDQERVHVLIGSVSTTLNEDIVKIAEARNKLLFLPALDTHSLSGTTHTFLVGASPAQQGLQLAQFAKSRLRASKIAIVRAKDEPFGNELAYAFRSNYRGNVIADSEIDLSPSSMAKFLSSVASQKPDAIVLPLFYEQALAFQKIAVAKGLQTTFLGGDSWDSPKLYRSPFPIPGKHYFISSFNQRVPEPKMQAFVKRFEAVYQRKPSALAFFGYSNMDLVLSAYLAANSSRSPAIKHQLLITKNINPLLGQIEVRRPGYVFWDNPVMQITPEGISMVAKMQAPPSP